MTPTEVVAAVHNHGFYIWRGLVAPDLVSAVLGPTIRHIYNVKAYVSLKYRVLRLNVVPEHHRLIVPEVVDVFNAALGPHDITIQEIYLAPPEYFKPHPWHQDEYDGLQPYHFMVWIAATPCGVDAPGLSFAKGNPRRYLGDDDEVVKAANEREIVNPVFAPGDAVFFDSFSLHKTNLTAATTLGRVAYKLGAKAK